MKYSLREYSRVVSVVSKALWGLSEGSCEPLQRLIESPYIGVRSASAQSQP